MKRIGGLNIKKVPVKRAPTRDRGSDDDFSWPMEPEAKKSQKSTKIAVKKGKFKVESESDEDYSMEDGFSNSDEEPSTSSSKRKRRLSDFDENIQHSRKSRTKTETLVAPPAKYSCGKCKNYFEDMEALMGHVKDKTCTGRGFPCEVCGKVFDSNFKHNAHRYVHEDKPQVYCDQCGQALRDAFALEAHIEAVHRRVVRTDCVFRCSKCSDTFNSHLDLLNHVKIHKNSPTMPCEICGKEVLKNSYYSHVNAHRMEKKHSCDVSSKKILRKEN